eukprot:m.354560 g.354560  ORF g.354560 m.354560 type:complete len:508 (-) comp17056_c0_seq1:407-1930(-)
MAGVAAYVVYAVLTGILAVIIHGLVNFAKRARAVSKLKGVPFKFPLGTIYKHKNGREHILHLLSEMRKNPSEPFRLWLGPIQPIVVLTTPADIRAVLEQKPKKSLMVYRYIAPWLGARSLLLLEGEEWHSMRRLLTPAFHQTILKSYTEMVTRASDLILDKFLTYAETPSEPVDVFQDYCMLTLDVICRCAFSHESNCQDPGVTDPYATAIAEIALDILKRVRTPAHMFDFVFYRSEAGKSFQKKIDFVHEYVEEIIAKRRKELDSMTAQQIARCERPGGRALMDFLDTLLMTAKQEGSNLTDEVIRHQCDTFLFAGHDTTSTALSWFTYLMSKHQDVQDKCRAEIIGVFGHEGEPSYDKLNQLAYTTATIKEALRVYPSIIGVARITHEPVTLSNGVTIEPGTTTALNMLCLHHNPTVWENPEEFNPERFMKTLDDPYSFMPFSVGRRNCIGMNFAYNEMRCVIAQLLRRLKFTPAKDYEPELESRIVLSSTTGIKVCMEKIVDDM